jgi:predicted nucleic acid-binding protein
MAQAQVKGMTLPVVDGLLAATALEHNLTAVTRNVNDFAVAGLSVINPWEA